MASINGSNRIGTWSLALALFGAGCAPDTYAEISGSVEGISIKPLTYYWGGPFLLFTSTEDDCMDVAWIQRGPTFASGDEAPVDYDLISLLFTFEGDAVCEGNYSVADDSVVDARVLSVQNGVLNVYKATSGELIVDEFNKDEHALGQFELGFDNGDLKGDFQIEYCNNMKVKT